MEIKQLQEKLIAILDLCEPLKSIDDGSYEVALKNHGYYRTMRDIHDLYDLEQAK